MENQMNITISVPLASDALKNASRRLWALAEQVQGGAVDGVSGVSIPVEEKEEKPVKKEKKKAAPAPVVEEPEEEPIDEDAFGEEEEEQGPTVEDVTKAFKAYAGKFSREAALKVLKSFKVKSVSELKPEIYPKVLKTLGA